ncbi:SET_domain-containing protein [Hexamita inflata]|uniref:SET domain-containing protein n=1 Tax=Hexamita inflata TaxID=28002 RepID=A0AA86PHV4_9EUKA|nr:SET domain-containing protein [Hexamita inflata]
MNIQKYWQQLKSNVALINEYNVDKQPSVAVSKAFFYLDEIDSAISVLNEIQSKEAEDCKKWKQILEETISQNTQGKFNWKQMITEAKNNQPITFHKYQNSQLEEFSDEEFGRGVKATADIPMGTILYAERAFLLGDEDFMFQQLKLKQEICKSSVNQYLKLNGGSTLSREDLKSKFNRNSFGMSLLLQNGLVCEQEMETAFVLTPALINHSCTPNCNWYFLGDIQFMVSTMHIKQGEQVFTCYFHPSQSSYLLKQQYLESGYKFTCKCQFCTNSSESLLKQLDTIKIQLNQLVQEAETAGCKSQIAQNAVIKIQNIIKQTQTLFKSQNIETNALILYTYSDLSYVQSILNHQFENALKTECTALSTMHFDPEQASFGKVQTQNQSYLTADILINAFNIQTQLHFLKSPNAKRQNWKQFTKLIFQLITGGCDQFEICCAARLEQAGVK